MSWNFNFSTTANQLFILAMFVSAIHMGALLCLSKSVLTGDDWRLSPHRPQPIKNHAKFYQVGV